MVVERKRATTAERPGQVFCFCAQGCRGEFLANLEQFPGVIY